MKTERKLAGVLCVLVLLGLADDSQAAQTFAYVWIGDGTTAYNASDSDSGVFTCNSFATQSHPPGGGPPSASTSAVVQWTDAGSHMMLTGTVTHNPSGMSGYSSGPGTSYANPGSWNAQLIGAGAVASCQLLLEGLQLTVAGPVGGPINTQSVSLSFGVGGPPTVTGSFTLASDGTGSYAGVYGDPADFNIYPDPVEAGVWHAEYTGPTSVPVELPVGSSFDLLFDVTLDEETNSEPLQGAFVSPSMHSVALAIPVEFEMVFGGIPTVSEWGMLVMAVLMFTVATVVVGLRRRAAPA